MNLDYSLYTDKQRTFATYEYLEAHPGLQKQAADKVLTDESSASKQLETLANYILYGKDESKLTNAVQQKSILPPQSRYRTFARKSAESLDGLMEQPTFDENALREYQEKNTYLHPKPQIHRPLYNPDGTVADLRDGVIPGMMELWESIDKYEHLMRIYERKEEPTTDAEKRVLEWNGVTAYKVKHWLIDLRKHQYFLKESYFPIVPSAFTFTHAGAIDWEADSGHWDAGVPNEEKLEVYAGDGNCEDPNYDYYKDSENTSKSTLWRKNKYNGQWEYFVLLRKHTIDFTNPLHVYQLLEHYDELKKSSYEDLNGQMKYILMAFEEIGQRTELTPIQETILDCKVIKWTNERIKQELQEKFGVNYNVNYISTIYTHNICERLAETAALMEREFAARNTPAMWKSCSCCKRKLLRDPQNFVRKTDTRDGFSARCKKCDKEVREKKKLG